MENRFDNLKPQKYQYYEGIRPRINYKPNGVRNANFTSPNFLSNSIFYKPSKNLGLNKNEMYLTTNTLSQCYSFDRLQSIASK